MSEIVFEGAAIPVPSGATVLEAIEASGATVPSSCRSGVCQSCLMRAVEGTPPPASQAGLRDTLRSQGYFLACVCRPEERLVVARPDAAGLRCAARVAAVQRLSGTVVELRLRCEGDFAYRPGQFVNLVHPNGAVRSYSLASLPDVDDTLHLHVALVPGGVMSGWVHEEAQAGDAVELLGPHGHCFYVPGSPEQPLLLAGTGTGLAPLLGIVKDAVQQGHTGPIHLFHGSLRREGLYLVDELRELADRWAHLHYHPCVLDGPAGEGVHVGAIDAYVAAVLPSLKGFRVYLCGHPDLVKLLQKKSFLMGAGLKDIFADAFVSAKPSAA